MIPKVPGEKLVEALKRFDGELRDDSNWLGWEKNQNHKYAIEHDGRLYPVKEIISMATGAPVDTFSGGGEANGYVEERGFKTVRLRSIQYNLEKVLGTYLTSRNTERFGRSASVWTYFELLQIALNESDPIKENSNIKVTWSAGKGNWAKAPWVALLDERETNTTRHGVYVVFLFREDMSGVYITLNQGVTEPLNEYGKRGGRHWLQENAQLIRSENPELAEANFSLDDEIDLRASRGLGEDYEYSTVAYKLYEPNQVPEDSMIIDDLANLILTYNKYLKGQTGQSSDEFLVGASGPGGIEAVQDEIELIKDKDKVAVWWSFPITGSKESVIRKQSNLYLYRGGPKQELSYRYGVEEYRSQTGSEGMLCPWPDYQLPEFEGKTKAGESASEVFKTWLLVDEIEELDPPIQLSELEAADGSRANPSSLVGGFAIWRKKAMLNDYWDKPTWIFQANPKIWDVVDAIESLEATVYSVRAYRKEIKSGDLVYLWESGPQRGIVGFAEVMDDPKPRRDAWIADGVKHFVEEDEEKKVRCWIRILGPIKPRISADEIRQIPELQGLTILKQPQGTNYKVNRGEAAEIRKLTESRSSVETILSWIQNIRTQPPRNSKLILLLALLDFLERQSEHGPSFTYSELHSAFVKLCQQKGRFDQEREFSNPYARLRNDNEPMSVWLAESKLEIDNTKAEVPSYVREKLPSIRINPLVWPVFLDGDSRMSIRDEAIGICFLPGQVYLGRNGE